MDVVGKSPPAPGKGDRNAFDLRARRSDRLLLALRSLCTERLQPALLLGLDAFDRQLYQMAEQSRSHLEQQCCFDSRAVVQAQRAAFLRRVLDDLGQRFAALGEQAAGESGAPDPDLSLLHQEEHELTAALSQLATRGEGRHGPALVELGYRLAVLAGSPPLESSEVPASPQALADGLGRAMAALDLPHPHRLLLVQALERALLPVLEGLYAAANEKLVADGILPHLKPFSTSRAPAAGAPAATPATTAPATTPARAPAPATGDHQAGPAATSREEPIAVLETLRDLLAGQRTHRPGAAAAAGSLARPDELQHALGALQQHLARVTDRAGRELRSAQRLREELLQHLNAGKPSGATRTALSAEQDDTVELVARLFEQLSQQLNHGQEAREVLGGLQIPMLRAALADRDFFDHAAHPARNVLGTLADAMEEWSEGADGQLDPELARHLHRLVDRTQHEEPSPALYAGLLTDIRQQLTHLSRRAQVSERRQVEAAQGRERLHQARDRATAVLEERFAANPPRGLLRTLLERAWGDVLALALLRHGEDSEAFAMRLRVTDQLLGRLPTDDVAALRQAVQDDLQQVGMLSEEASQVAQRLIAEGDEADPAAARSEPAGGVEGEVLSATDLALRLKQRHRLGDQQSQPKRAVAAETELGPEEKRIHERLRRLPFGSWFEFIGEDGGRTRCKLAWFSPVSGNSLFVNRRGQRVREMNLRGLAEALSGGRVREVPSGGDSLLDRAWRALTGSLQRSPTQT